MPFKSGQSKFGLRQEQCCGAGAGRSRYVLVGRSRSQCEGPAPAPGSSSTLDKTKEILNDILFVCSNIDEMLIKNKYRYLEINKFSILSSEEVGLL